MGACGGLNGGTSEVGSRENPLKDSIVGNKVPDSLTPSSELGTGSLSLWMFFCGVHGETLDLKT